MGMVGALRVTVTSITKPTRVGRFPIGMDPHIFRLTLLEFTSAGQQGSSAQTPSSITTPRSRQ